MGLELSTLGRSRGAGSDQAIDCFVTMAYEHREMASGSRLPDESNGATARPAHEGPAEHNLVYFSDRHAMAGDMLLTVLLDDKVVDSHAHCIVLMLL
jgi:hypothetical protein